MDKELIVAEARKAAATAALADVQNLLMSEGHVTDRPQSTSVAAAEGRLRLGDGRDMSVEDFVASTFGAMVTSAELVWDQVPLSVQHRVLHALHRLRLWVEDRLVAAARDHAGRALTVLSVGRWTDRLGELEDRHYRATRSASRASASGTLEPTAASSDVDLGNHPAAADSNISTGRVAGEGDGELAGKESTDGR